MNEATGVPGHKMARVVLKSSVASRRWSRAVTIADLWWGAVWLIRLVLAVMLVFAAVSKFVSPGPIADTLRADHVPERFIPVATSLIAVVELMISGILIIARSGARPLLLAAVVFVIFAIQLSYLKSQSILSCNCFSGLIEFESTSAALNARIVVNTAVALVCAALGF